MKGRILLIRMQCASLIKTKEVLSIYIVSITYLKMKYLKMYKKTQQYGTWFKNTFSYINSTKLLKIKSFLKNFFFTFFCVMMIFNLVSDHQAISRPAWLPPGNRMVPPSSQPCKRGPQYRCQVIINSFIMHTIMYIHVHKYLTIKYTMRKIRFDSISSISFCNFEMTR